MREIANIRTERPEFDSKNMSGIALERKQASSDQGSAPVHGNWDMTQEILGVSLIEHILRRDTYTDDEIRQLVDEEDLIDPELLAKAKEQIMAAAQIAPTPPPPPDVQVLARSDPRVQALMIAEYQKHLTVYLTVMKQVEELAPQMATKMLLDELKELQKGKTKFGVKSSLSQSAGTFRDQKFFETLALNDVLIKSGQPGVGRKILIKASDVPYKEEILQQPETAAPAGAPVPALTP
jgi:hypothetical protein